jgi:hypothetical protein
LTLSRRRFSIRWSLFLQIGIQRTSIGVTLSFSLLWLSFWWIWRVSRTGHTSFTSSPFSTFLFWRFLLRLLWHFLRLLAQKFILFYLSLGILIIFNLHLLMVVIIRLLLDVLLLIKFFISVSCLICFHKFFFRSIFTIHEFILCRMKLKVVFVFISLHLFLDAICLLTSILTRREFLLR